MQLPVQIAGFKRRIRFLHQFRIKLPGKQRLKICSMTGTVAAEYLAHAKAKRNFALDPPVDEFFRSLQEDTFPILYGVYYLETGSYPENHKQILERYPSLDCADFIETITGIIDKVDSMEE